MGYTMSNIIRMDTTGFNTIHTVKETTVGSQGQKGTQAQTLGHPLIIQVKKEKKVGGLRIEKEI